MHCVMCACLLCAQGREELVAQQAQLEDALHAAQAAGSSAGGAAGGGGPTAEQQALMQHMAERLQALEEGHK